MNFTQIVILSSLQFALAWDANTEQDLAGYKIYYGQESRSYSRLVDVRNVTTFPLELSVHDQMFFAVTAYDSANNESSFSNEVYFSSQSLDPKKPRAFSINGILSADPNSGGSIGDTVYVNEGDTLLLRFTLVNLLEDSVIVSQDSIFWNAHISEREPNDFYPVFDSPISMTSEDTLWQPFMTSDSLLFVTVSSYHLIGTGFIQSESVWWIPVVIRSEPGTPALVEKEIMLGIPLRR